MFEEKERAEGERSEISRGCVWKLRDKPESFILGDILRGKSENEPGRYL
jgi:hypothetical protein